MPALDDDPVAVAEYIAERRLAKKFLFWAFVISVVFIHVAYTYIIYKQYRVFVNAFNTQFACNVEDALEMETARYQLRQHYLEPDDKTNKAEIRRYNFWRIWVLSMPVMIAIAIFMIVKYSFNVIPPFFYLFTTITVLYLGIYQIVHLPRYFGYPSYWDIFAEKMMNGKLQQAIQYHTQGYDQIHLMFESRLSPCLDEEAEYSCMELLPAKLKRALIHRYMSVHPDTNQYQATEFFETAFKKRNYDIVIGYMRLGKSSDDLEQLSGLIANDKSEHIIDDEALNTFRSNFSKDLIADVNDIFKDAFWKIVVPGWIVLIYFMWFHRAFQRWFKIEGYEPDDDLDPTAYLFWVLVVGVWFLLVFMF
jgi:membrane protein YdbS with pleckstrin-like domain